MYIHISDLLMKFCNWQKMTHLLHVTEEILGTSFQNKKKRNFGYRLGTIVHCCVGVKVLVASCPSRSLSLFMCLVGHGLNRLIIISLQTPNTKVSWCSWLSRQSNTLKVSGSSPGEASYLFLFGTVLFSLSPGV